MKHNFTEVPNHPRRTPGTRVWRCERCDSEAIFKNKYSQSDVNAVVEKKIPCIPVEATGKIIRA